MLYGSGGAPASALVWGGAGKLPSMEVVVVVLVTVLENSPPMPVGPVPEGESAIEVVLVDAVSTSLVFVNVVPVVVE